MDKQKIEIKVNFNWWLIWSAGWLFFVGYINFFADANLYPWYTQFGVTILSYFFWPLLLGLFSGGHIK
jgi:hypothetical protein